MLTCCRTCPWQEVVDPSKSSSSVVGAHKKFCRAYQESRFRFEMSRTGGQDGSAGGNDGIDELEDDPVTGSLVVETEDHENFLVRVVQPSNGKTAAEKRANLERLHAFDTSLSSRLTRIEAEMVVVEATPASEGADGDLFDPDSDTDAPAAPAAPVVEVDKYHQRQLASPHVLYHQREVEKKLMNPLPDMRGGKDPATITELYDLGMTLSLSHREGDLLLDYLAKHGNGPFYKSWEGMQAAFDRQFKNICVLNRLEIELPVEFFGLNDKGGTPLKKTVCEYYDVLLRIGDAFLEIKPDDFSKSFSMPDLVKGSAERIYSTFPKAKLFQRFVVWTKSTHGDEAVPVVVAIYFDEAEATSSRAACPLIMFILNCTGESFKPIFLGYCPVSLPYSDEYLTKLLNSRALTGHTPSKSSCKYAIRFAKRQALQRFLVHVLKPIVECDKGILLQLGARRMYPRGTDPEIIFAVPHLCHLIGDSAALHDVGSVKIGCKFCRCRMCTCSNLNAFGRETEFAWRDSEETYALTSKLGDYEVYKFQRSCGLLSEEDRKLSRVEREKRRIIRKIGKFRGVIPGENPVILLWEKLEKARIIVFAVALCIDILHTIWKGILESAAACAMQLVHCIGLHQAELALNLKYRDAMGNLDSRLASFAAGKESLQPFPFVHLEKVSDLLKEESKKAKGQERATGLLTGSFPAWQMRNLCLQLVFGIGWDGSILPNEDMEFGEGRFGNPTLLCLNALIGVLRVAAYCEARELTESQLQLMHKYIANASCRLLQLYDFKQLVCLKVGYIRRSGSKPAKSHEMPSNFKTHGMSHLPRQYRLFGEWSAYDASAGEKYHQVVVSGAMKRSSGVIETTQQEMAIHVVRKQFVKMQAENLPAASRSATEELDGEAEEEEGLVKDCRFQTFHAVLSLGSVSLSYTSDDDFISTDTGGENDFLHPLLDHNELWGLFVMTSRTETFIKKVIKGFATCDPDYSIRLFGAVKCDGDLAAGVKPWFLRANRHYHGNFRGKRTRQGISLFNSFEVNYATALGEVSSFAKVLGLVGFQYSPPTSPLDSKTEIWVAIARYKQCAKSRFAPFDQYVFEQIRGKLSIDFVSLDSIKRPCFMCVSCDAPLNRRVESRANYLYMQWSCIPFSKFNKVLNVAIESTAYDEESAVQDSSLASSDVIAQVLAEFELEGEYNHMLTPTELETLLPSRGGQLESGSDTDSDRSTNSDSDGESD